MTQGEFKGKSTAKISITLIEFKKYINFFVSFIHVLFKYAKWRESHLKQKMFIIIIIITVENDNLGPKYIFIQ